MTDGDITLEEHSWTTAQDDDKVRLDQFICARAGFLTRSQVKKLIDAGLAWIDGDGGRPAKKLRPGQSVVLHVVPSEPMNAEPQEIPLDIKYEDDYLVVLDKPRGLVVHPAPGHWDGTLVNGLLFACRTAGGEPLRPGIVHRLDKDTSGLMVVAKTEECHLHLSRQFHDRSVDRRYMVLVAGNPPEKGIWDTLHGRSNSDRKKFTTRVTRGKPAISVFEKTTQFQGAALLRVILKTGRTHQVRVHCHDHGFGVLGDPWYGPKHLSIALQGIHKKLEGQALHAEILGFEHPATGKRLLFRSDPPLPFAEALEALHRDLA